jgi:hypothetical protein
MTIREFIEILQGLEQECGSNLRIVNSDCEDIERVELGEFIHHDTNQEELVYFIQ